MKKEINSDLIRGHINTIILSALSEKDKYGYEIINEISEKSHGQYTLKQPTLYSALARLEKQGFITSYWGKDSSSGGRRKYFKLTEDGTKISKQNLSEWEYSRTVIDKLISEKEYDLNKAAPSSVDFNILKMSTTQPPILSQSASNDGQVKGAATNKDSTTLQLADERILAQKKYQNLRENKSRLTDIFENTLNIGIEEKQTDSEKTDENEQRPKRENEKLDLVLDSSTIGKIDFTDLFEMAENDGIKLRACRSNELKRKQNKSFNKNKNIFISALIVFLTAAAELALFYFVFDKKTNIIFKEYLIAGGAFALLPLITFFIYISGIGRDSISAFKSKSAAPMFIIALNIFLLIISAALILDINLLSTASQLKYIALPFVLLTNLPLSTLYYNRLSSKFYY